MADISGVYIDHSGFMLELPSGTLIFDWVNGNLPKIRTDKPLYVFISHIHNDHFKQSIFDIKRQYPNTEFFLGYDRSIPQLNPIFENLPDAIADSLSCFNGEQKLYSNDGKMLIKTLASTDFGVAFLVEIDGKRIFHAGDLYIMAAPPKDPLKQALAAMTGNFTPSNETPDPKRIELFEKYTEPLRGLDIDYGMIPVDPRYPVIAHETVKRYLAKANFKAWSPMHLWGRYDFINTFLSTYPAYASRMVAVTTNPNVKKQIELGKPFVLRFGGFLIQSRVSVMGRDTFAKCITALPGDVLVFRLNYKNVGYSVQKSITCYDSLPPGIEYIPDSTTFWGSFNKDAVNQVSDRLFNGGINVGDFRQNEEMVLTYKARISDDASLFKPGDTVVYNNAKVATADGTGYVKAKIIVRR